MVSQESQFAIGGTLVLTSIIPIAIAILGSFPALNLGLLINFGGIGLAIGFAGFYLVGLALFRN